MEDKLKYTLEKKFNDIVVNVAAKRSLAEYELIPVEVHEDLDCLDTLQNVIEGVSNNSAKLVLFNESDQSIKLYIQLKNNERCNNFMDEEGEIVQTSSLYKYGIPLAYVNLFKWIEGREELNYDSIDLNISGSLKKSLFKYQLEDAKRAVMELNGRTLLALEMGCGKTIISITIAQHYGGKVLVVCPSYLRVNWRNELIKWGFASYDRIQIITCGKDDIYLDAVDAVIISYDLAKVKIDDLEMLSFETIIVDESQYLKNRGTQRVKILKKYLTTASNRLLLLSGTPATNSPRDLFVQLSILYPKYFAEYYDFSRRYCDGKKGPFGWEDHRSSNEGELNYILGALMIRRLKKDILKDLPGKRRMKVYLEVKITGRMKKDMAKLITLNDELSRIGDIDEASPHLRKKFNQRMYLISQMFNSLAVPKAKPVVEYVSNMIDEKAQAADPIARKIIVFAHHQTMMEALQVMLNDRGIDHIRIDGTTMHESRQDQVDEFVDAESGMQVAILSLKAASTGLNFTPVSTIVFAEVLFEIAVMKQAEDRINRIGCKTTCDYFYLLAKDTIDEKVFRNVSNKFKTLEKIMDHGGDREGFKFL